MRYYRVHKDGQMYSNGKYHTLVKDELYTENEVNKYGLNIHRLQPIEVSKKKTYWFFGARFEIKD